MFPVHCSCLLQPVRTWDPPMSSPALQPPGHAPPNSKVYNIGSQLYLYGIPRIPASFGWFTVIKVKCIFSILRCTFPSNIKHRANSSSLPHATKTWNNISLVSPQITSDLSKSYDSNVSPQGLGYRIQSKQMPPHTTK